MLGSRIKWERPQIIAGTILDEATENIGILVALTSTLLVHCESSSIFARRRPSLVRVRTRTFMGDPIGSRGPSK